MSSPNTELEDKWAGLRPEDEVSDEDDEEWQNTTFMVAMAGTMVCEETKKTSMGWL